MVTFVGLVSHSRKDLIRGIRRAKLRLIIYMSRIVRRTVPTTVVASLVQFC